MRLFIDTETYSELPISVGTHRYARHCEVMLVSYAIDDGEPMVWDRTDGSAMPEVLRFALESHSCEVVMHNSQFDRTVLREALGYDILVSRIWDTMAQAQSHSLPGSLGVLCDIFKVPQEEAKLGDGKRLIQRFCKPAPANHKTRRYTAQTHPEQWQRFKQYAANDISAMRTIMKRMPCWNYPSLKPEADLFVLDQIINDRGFQVDLALAKSAVAAVQKEQARLAEQMYVLTKGEVGAPSQRDALLQHIAKRHGVTLPDLTSNTVDQALEAKELPAPVLNLLSIRAQANATSTSKYKRLLETINEDARQRGVMMYCGASRTGRFSSKMFQAQNLKRGTRQPDVLELGIEALKAGAADLFEPDVMDLVSDTLRGCIIAPGGRKLVVSDLSNIEGRVAAWLCGEDWKVTAFEQFDQGVGQDLYKVAYARSFRIKPEDVTKDQRQIGKVQELALQYQGGVGAFHTFATNMRIDLEDKQKRAYDIIPTDVMERSESWRVAAKDKGFPDFGLSDQAWVVCDALKNLWRQAHPGISGMWTQLDEGVRHAIDRPGELVTVGKLTVTRHRNWLRIILPSGRSLSYAGIQVGKDGVISYMGINQLTRKWERMTTYGGKWLEQCCQAIARDVLTFSMQDVEQAGYQIVLSVHDELICEAPDSVAFNAEDLSEIMSRNPLWAIGLPLAAGGFECKRYRKG